MRVRILVLALYLAVSVSSAIAAEGEPIKPSEKDKCAVCGMFVSKYHDFLAQVILEDNTSLFFDGPKDMFKFLANMKHYLPSKAGKKIKEILVTDYYKLKATSAKKAWYVMGSDILGPMGRELIPFGNEKDAIEFMNDHNGKRRVRFSEVTPTLLRELEKDK